MASKERLTIGLDLGDMTSRYCILSEAGEVVSEGSVATSKSRDQFVIRKDGVEPSGAGSGDAFPVGEPADREPRARSDRGQSAQGKTDYAERAQERSDRCAATGATGASGPAAVEPDPAPGRIGAGGLGGDSGTGGVDGEPDGADQLRTGIGEADAGERLEEVRCRPGEREPGGRTESGTSERAWAVIEERGRGSANSLQCTTRRSKKSRSDTRRWNC